MNKLKELSYKKTNHLKWIYNRMIEVNGENPNTSLGKFSMTDECISKLPPLT